jgi:hypothetical protein
LVCGGTPNVNSQRLDCECSRYEIIGLTRTILEENGFSVESPGVVKGISGVSQHFALLAYRGNLFILIEVTESRNPIDETEVIKLFAKILDIRSLLNLSKVFFVTLPGISTSAKRLAQNYQFTIIEAGDKANFAGKLRNHLIKLQ